MPHFEKLLASSLEEVLPLLGEIEAGPKFSIQDASHRKWIQARFQELVDAGVDFYLGASDSGRPYGIAGLKETRGLFTPPTFEIVSLGVIEGMRRQGFGSSLLHHCIQLAKKARVSSIFVKTYAADADVIYFYGRQGFVPVAVIPDKFGPEEEGVIVMRKPLRLSIDGPS